MITPKFTFNVEMGLPVALSNKPFNDIMQGLGCASIYGQYSLPFHLNFGLGVRYSIFTINEFSVPIEVVGQVHTGAAFVKVGWDKFHTERFATDIGVKVGYSQNYASTDINKANGLNPIQVDAIIIEPTLGIILAANEKNSYRWSIGYAIQGYGFRPSMIGIDTNDGYNADNFNKLTQSLVVGFGWTYYFNKDKKL
jgi:hypothetical protein